MKRLSKIMLVICVLLLIPAAGIGVITYSHADFSKVPRLESGDLIFQTHLSGQTAAVSLASSSLYSHVGIIRRQGNTITVIHAINPVEEWPLDAFVENGWGEQFTVMRYAGLSAQQREDIVQHALHYLGRPYNFVFHMGGNEIYCSQLPYLAFKESNIALGTVQKISELNLNNFAVQKLFARRWKKHPSCQKPGMDAAGCWNVVMEEPIITPVSEAHDKHLTTIYSNYWF